MGLPIPQIGQPLVADDPPELHQFSARENFHRCLILQPSDIAYLEDSRAVEAAFGRYHHPVDGSDTRTVLRSVHCAALRATLCLRARLTAGAQTPFAAHRRQARASKILGDPSRRFHLGTGCGRHWSICTHWRTILQSHRIGSCVRCALIDGPAVPGQLLPIDHAKKAVITEITCSYSKQATRRTPWHKTTIKPQSVRLILAQAPNCQSNLGSRTLLWRFGASQILPPNSVIGPPLKPRRFMDLELEPVLA